MTKRAGTLPADDLYRRIDEIAMSQADRDRAKASLRNAELVADFVIAIATAVRRLGALVSRRFKALSVVVDGAAR